MNQSAATDPVKQNWNTPKSYYKPMPGSQPRKPVSMGIKFNKNVACSASRVRLHLEILREKVSLIDRSDRALI